VKQNVHNLLKGEMKMENARTTIWVMVVVLSLASSPVLALIDLTGGATYDIDYEINDHIRVDYQDTSGMRTTVNLLNGGSIAFPYSLFAHEDSRVNILGGSIGYYLEANDRSQVTVSGGSIAGYLEANDNSQVSFSGGSTGSNLVARDSSQVSFSGGSIGNSLLADDTSQINFFGGSVGDSLIADFDGVLTIIGSDFAVDGVPFGYGELTSILGGIYHLEPSRHLTGTLASGGSIDNDFYIGNDAKIELIPVPAPGALVLGSIGLGFVSWLRRRRTL
jgi:hypothetical protein